MESIFFISVRSIEARNERRHSLEKLVHFDDNLNGVHNIDGDDIIKVNGLKIYF